MLIDGLYVIKKFSVEENKIQSTIELEPGHPVFKGHFPGNPVMPGVCMIQIIKELTEKAMDKELFLSITSNVKFMALINPNKNKVLNLSIILSQEDSSVKIKNTVHFNDTLALKMNATFNIIPE